MTNDETSPATPPLNTAEFVSRRIKPLAMRYAVETGRHAAVATHLERLANHIRSTPRKDDPWRKNHPTSNQGVSE